MKPLFFPLFLLTLLLSPFATHAALPAPLHDKTLVAWAAPSDLTQRGGSILSLDDQQSHFDGLILGEIVPGKWMLGSDFYRRTEKDQAAWPQETATTGTFVQIAAVFHGKEVTLYREGKSFARYTIPAPLSLGKDSAVLIGLRHLESTDGACFAGAIDDARIYDTALSADQITALQPNKQSDIKPVAWWNFENGRAEDLVGNFPEAKLVGKARIEGGKLILDGKGSYLVTPASAAIAAAKPRQPAGPTPYNPMPVYHFTRPHGNDGAPFDPNGAVFYKGRYHLGYIDEVNRKPIWGHVSSTDLIHWKLHRPMLDIGPETGIFSGNAFFDKQGRVVLSYHGLGLGGNCLAIAADRDDELNVFNKLPANPVMKDPGWDPHTWVEDGTYYSISGGNPGSGRVASLYTCTDPTLSKWNLLGPLMSHDMPDVFGNEDISCPDFFQLGGKHILLCISHVRGARYYIGRFENKQFHPEAHYRMNWPGGTCFAPETLLDDKGRRLMWTWVLGSPYTLSLPRVLSMAADGIMHIEPIEELNALRSHPQSLKAIPIPADQTIVVEAIQGDAKEIQVTLDPQKSAQCGLKVRRSPDGAEETAIAYDPARKVLRIETDKSSLNPGTRPRTYAMTFMLPKGADNPIVSAQEAPLELQPGEPLHLRIYLDHSILEVYANGRQCLTQRLWPTRPDSTGIALFSRGGAAEMKSLEAWDMAPLVLDKTTQP